METIVGPRHVKIYKVIIGILKNFLEHYARKILSLEASRFQERLKFKL